MKIDLLSIEPANSKLNTFKINQEDQKSTVAFDDFFKDAINNLNKLHIEADELTTKLVTGEITDLHQVMIASEKAGIALQFAIQVRNKLVEAYQEIMRMQM
ncbi:MAG: flagellar hook-basal body complex protein FliE [Bacillota bacterium]|nr:flagellar hook-basal body complex protein FliE [Bacillota bacterium]